MAQVPYSSVKTLGTVIKVQCLLGQVALTARTCLGFCSTKLLTVLLLPPRMDASHHRVTPSIKFASTHYTPEKREALKAKCSQFT